MNEFTLDALRALHRKFLEEGERFHELHFACARPMDLRGQLPQRTAWPGISSDRLHQKSLGLSSGDWQRLIGFSVKSGIAVIDTVWLEHDGHLWEGAYINGSSAPANRDDKTAYNNAEVAFKKLKGGTDKFIQLAGEAARTLAMDCASVDWPRQPNPAHRWLEGMLQQPNVTSHVNDGFATLRVEGNIFDAAARMIERLVSSQNEKPRSGSQAGAMPTVTPASVGHDPFDGLEPPIVSGEGPLPPNQLSANGKTVELEPKPFKLVAFFWSRPLKDRVLIDTVAQNMWKPNQTWTPGGFANAVTKANAALLEVGEAWTLSQKDGFVLKS